MSRKDDEKRTPEEWRELLRTRYDYPEETKQGNRRARRQARREYRTDEREREQEWLKQQRRREDSRSPGGIILLVLLVLALGAAARWVPWFGTGDEERPAGRTSPSAEQPADPGPSSSSSTPSPTPSASADVDLSDPDTVAEQWARHYWTRNPPVDEKHTAAVRRAAPWMTDALAENLSEYDDPAWERLVSHGGVSTVKDVKVSAPKGGLPPDNPLRKWRAVRTTIAEKGYTNRTEHSTVQTELTRADGEWRVSRVLGL